MKPRTPPRNPADMQIVHSDDHDQGLAHDLSAIVGRRRFLAGLAGAGAGLALGGCDFLPWPSRAEAEVKGTAADGSTCIVHPSETAGPFPADGSNRAHGTLANVLRDSGIVRKDMRANIGGAADTAAPGVPFELDILLVDVRNGCKPRAGHAIYVWHCDANGDYSIYNLPDATFLRAVGVSDDAGGLSFTTIVPGCYRGRFPHIHFEVYPDLAHATDYRNRLLTSQLAMTDAMCSDTYKTSAIYAASLKNYADTPPVTEDGIFADNTPAQLAAQTVTVTGDIAAGYLGHVTIGI